MTDQERDPLESVEPSRRSFIKKMAAAAFVAPVISSFGMQSLAAASGAGKPKPPRQQHANMPCPPPPPCDDHKKPKPKPKKPKRPN
jgi:hypothetical protein